MLRRLGMSRPIGLLPKRLLSETNKRFFSKDQEREHFSKLKEKKVKAKVAELEEEREEKEQEDKDASPFDTPAMDEHGNTFGGDPFDALEDEALKLLLEDPEFAAFINQQLADVDQQIADFENGVIPTEQTQTQTQSQTKTKTQTLDLDQKDAEEFASAPVVESKKIDINNEDFLKTMDEFFQNKEKDAPIPFADQIEDPEEWLELMETQLGTMEEMAQELASLPNYKAMEKNIYDRFIEAQKEFNASSGPVTKESLKELFDYREQIVREEKQKYRESLNDLSIACEPYDLVKRNTKGLTIIRRRRILVRAAKYNWIARQKINYDFYLATRAPVEVFKTFDEELFERGLYGATKAKVSLWGKINNNAKMQEKAKAAKEPKKKTETPSKTTRK